MSHKRRSLNWTYLPAEQVYTPARDGVECKVWQFRPNEWAGIVTRGEWSTATYRLSSAEQAQVWCEEELAHDVTEILVSLVR